MGIINLNTFELLRLEINRYNNHGQLLEEIAGYMQSSHLSGEKSYVHAYTFPDNGYAHVQISGVNYKIDRTTIQSNLCQRCLDTVNDFGTSSIALAEYARVLYRYGIYNKHINSLSSKVQKGVVLAVYQVFA